MDDWNEVRLILAIARSGTLASAARALGIDHSTVFRRLQAIERGLGNPVFERLPGGTYQPTALGERMARAGERMEDEAAALARDIVGSDRRLTGRLRVTCSETLAYRILTRHIAAFREAHPGVVVELMIDNRVLSLSRREADIALRPRRPKEGDLWGRKLADVGWTAYAADTWRKAHDVLPDPAGLARHALIGWDEAAAGININTARWLAGEMPEAAFVYRTNSLVNQLLAAKSGMGIAVLPCYLGDPEPGVGRALADPIPELTGELWMVTHTDLRRTARIRAFFEVVGGGIAGERPLIEGRAPRRDEDAL